MAALMGLALAQEGGGQDGGQDAGQSGGQEGPAEPEVDAPVDPPEEDPTGRVQMFRIVERAKADHVGANLRVTVDVQGNAAPTVVLVGPEGLVQQDQGTELVYESLAQGDYLVAATADEMRLAFGTLTADDGQDISARLTLFNLRRYYLDDADTAILGIFHFDVSDNDADGPGALEILVEPSARLVLVGSDGYVTVVRQEQEERTLEGLAPGRYVVAATLDGHRLAVAHVSVSDDERGTLEFDLEPAGS